MKKITLSIIFLISTLSAYSQTLQAELFCKNYAISTDNKKIMLPCATVTFDKLNVLVESSRFSFFDEICSVVNYKDRQKIICSGITLTIRKKDNEINSVIITQAIGDDIVLYK